MVRDFAPTAQSQAKKQKKKFFRVLLILGFLSVIFFVISISVGRAGIMNPIMIFRSVFEKSEKNKRMLLIFRNIRAPRAYASFLVGACLAISGLVYQTTFNNKLVSPGILGVSSGCCVGAGIAILFGMSTSMIRLFAFVFGFGAVVIATLLLKLFRNHSALTLVLSGIIVGSFMDSVLALIKYAADKQEKLADIIVNDIDFRLIHGYIKRRRQYKICACGN